jgi:hypothetical protein
LDGVLYVGENSCNSGDGTDQTGPILDVYDDDGDDDDGVLYPKWSVNT